MKKDLSSLIQNQSVTHDAYDADKPLMLYCACGQAHSPKDHNSQAVLSVEDTSRNFMEAAFVKALFPVDSIRRNFIRAVGTNTARAAIASMMPLGALEAMAMVTLSSVLLGFMACGFSGRNDSDHVTVLSIATANQHNLKRAT